MIPKEAMLEAIYMQACWIGTQARLRSIIDAYWPNAPSETNMADRKVDAEPGYGEWLIGAPGEPFPTISQRCDLPDGSTAHRLKKPTPVLSVLRWYGGEYTDGSVHYNSERQPHSTFWEDHPLIDGKPDFSRQPTWGKL